MEVQRLCGGCVHLLYGPFDFVRRAAGDVDSSAMKSELQCGFVSDPRVTYDVKGERSSSVGVLEKL